MITSNREHPELGPARLVEVADRVFAYIQPDGSWYINNTGFVVGSSSVICIDSCSTEKRTRAFLDSIASVTSAPVGMLINTHHHGDHTYGNSIVGTGTIIAHENCRTELIATGMPANSGIWDPVEWGELTMAPPTVTFTDRVRLWSDDRPIDVSYVGRRAHTNNDSVVWLPDQRVLFCGDLLFNGGTPFLLMGSVVGAIDVLTNVIAPIPATTIVPGHGAPCDHSLIPAIVGYLEFVLATAKAGRAAGLSPLETARETHLGEYARWLDSERIVGNLHRAYADLADVDVTDVDVTDEYGSVDIMGALKDMIDYNGGKPLSCYA